MVYKKNILLALHLHPNTLIIDRKLLEQTPTQKKNHQNNFLFSLLLLSIKPQQAIK